MINPVIIQITIIPIKYPTTEIGPKNIVKNNHNKIYHAIDSENIMYPLSIPKCSVSKPVMISFPFVIAKAQSELHERILKKVGADSIIRPEKEMGTRIARSLVSGNFADWIELSDDYSMLETKIPKNWVGKQLIDLKIREKYGVNVVGIVENGKMDVTIDPYRIFVENTIVILIGSNEALKRFEKE